MNELRLGSTRVGPNTPPYVIAEIGVNHEGSMDLAKRLIREAKAGGCHAAKFQTYRASTLASRHSPAYWDTTKEPTLSQFALFSKYDYFGEPQYRELAAYCAEVGIDFASTPFDDEAIEFLDQLMPYFKVASADLTNVPLLRRVAAKRKPVLLSTGASTLGEVDEAIVQLQAHGCPCVVPLHCVLNYPTPNEFAHLAMIKGLARAYPDLLIGYSDHTLPDPSMTPLVTAYLLGARVLEKHFTYDKTLPGNDHYHAMDQDDARRLFAQLGVVAELLGPSDHKQPLKSEGRARRYARRSLVATKRLPAGTTIDPSCVTYKRPGTGISPRFWDDVMGMRTTSDIDEDHVLAWADLTK
jgi:sialic acid synthase SpsE